MDLVPGITGTDVASPADMRAAVLRLQSEVSKLPQYEPPTKHYFHAGMYCREVYRDAGVLVVGKVHKKAHFYVIASGTVCITTDDGAKRVVGPAVLACEPGTKRAVYSETPTTCLTFHIVNATTVEEAERELVEDDENDMYLPGNRVRQEVLK
jgi:hypothetical protein